MLRPLLFAMASALVLGACASSPDTAGKSDSSATETVVVPSAYDLGFQTADELVAAGNTPTAIQPLMQLLGDTSLTPDQTANVLFKLGERSGSPTGFNAEGAVAYFKEVLSDYPMTGAAAPAVRILRVLAPELDHEALDDAVEVQAVVEPVLHELHEVAGGDRHLVLEDLSTEAAERGLEGRGRIRHVGFVTRPP